MLISVIFWGVMTAAFLGALLHLWKSPMLTGAQKFLTSVVSLAVTLPLGCVLLVPLFFLLWRLPSNEIGSVLFFGPASAFIVSGIVIGRMVAVALTHRSKNRGQTTAPHCDGKTTLVQPPDPADVPAGLFHYARAVAMG